LEAHLHSKRHGQILEVLEVEGAISISELASRLGVSSETVRRDVRPLTEDGSVVRIHGAVGLAGQIGEAPFQRRMRENAEAKQHIARTVAEKIADGDSIMFDTGTTTSFVARELIRHRRLTVVTNSLDIARTLATINGNRVFMAGGELRHDSGAAFGPQVLEFVSRFTVRHAIISAGAVDEASVMDFDFEEAELARIMLARAEGSIVVTDFSKFGRRGLVAITGLGNIAEIVTDRPPPDPIRNALTGAGTRITLPSGAG
jgi:DeoR family glycerol-3-phosphate regulon repressor